MHYKLMIQRVLGVFLIVALLPGCTAYREVPLRTGEISIESNAPDPRLVSGQNVKLLLSSGEIFEGKIGNVGSTWIEVEKPGNFGLEVRSYEFSEIEKAEVEEPSKISDILLAPAAFVGIFAAIVVIAIARGDIPVGG